MRRQPSPWLAFLVVSLSPVASVGDSLPIAPRLHLVTPKRKARLSEPAKRVIDATAAHISQDPPKGKTGWGSTFVVERTSSGQALLLMTAHGKPRRGDIIEFHREGPDSVDKVRARIESVVDKSDHFDCALVEVKLPKGAGRISALPVSLRRPDPGHAAYSVSFPGLHGIDDVPATLRNKLRVSASLKERIMVLSTQIFDPKPVKTIQLGLLIPMSHEDPKVIRTESLTFNVPSNLEGASGSALVDRRQQAAVAMQWGKLWGKYQAPDGTMLDMPLVIATPIDVIVKVVLAKQRAAKQGHPLVQRWLQRLERQQPMEFHALTLP